MPSFTIYVDYSIGNDTTGTGDTGAPYRTLVKAAATPPVGLASGDDVNIRVRNGASGDLTTQRAVFNSASWNGTTVRIRPDIGHVPWRVTTPAGASEYIIRFFLSTNQVNLLCEDFVWSLADNQQAVQGLNTVTSLTCDYTLRRGTVSWSAWNQANQLVVATAATSSGNITVESVTTTGMAGVFRFNGISGNVSLQQNTFGLGAGTGTWRVLDWGGPNNTRLAPNIISSRNTWTGDTANGFCFIGSYLPLIQRSDKIWRFEGDTFDLDGAVSTGKLLNIDDCDSASTHDLSIEFQDCVVVMDVNATVINIGRNVGAYTNAQMPRKTTLANDCTRRLARLIINGCDMLNKNASPLAALIAVRIGVMSTKIHRSELSAPYSEAHTCNFISNDVVITESRLIGLLPCLAFGDRITVDRCYISGERPFIAGKTGGGLDEASQGHTVTNSTIVCTSEDSGLAAFDTYGWQGNDPYGPVWYDSDDTPGGGGTSIGLRGWTVRNNVFIATSGGSPVYLGRPTGASSHAGGQFTSTKAMLDFLADGNGGEGPWIDETSIFSGNTLIVGQEPILSDIIGIVARESSVQSIIGLIA